MFEETLHQIEQENNITILYCAEAGSRAWGFPSPDSDYDIRFIYVHPIEWYLQLTPGRDTMEWFSEDRLLDFSGWELRKALNLFATCNPAFNEQLISPIVYWEKSQFSQPMRELIPNYFQPVRAFHHYFSIAEKMLANHPFGGPIGVKAYFYIIRPLLACQFILNHKVQPPTLFSDLVQQSDLSDKIQSRLSELIELKKITKEKDSVTVSDDLIQFTSHLYQEMLAHRAQGVVIPGIKTEISSKQPLETLFQRWTLNK